jgi:hypothetical protein
MGFLECLFLLFTALKLIGIITWSWWIVCIPLYPAILLWIFAGGFIISVFSSFRNDKKKPMVREIPRYRR